MLLKRFEARTLPEALARVRAECGDDALLVETKATRTGFVVVAARPQPANARAAVDAAAARPARWTRGFQQLAEAAAGFGLPDAVLHAVENALLGTRVDLSLPGDPALPGLAAKVLASLVRCDRGVEDCDPAFRAIALIGPTGVGKTTTLAKLAARARDRGERVAILTLDTYRMAAVEQLRAYADLLATPFEVCFTATDLRRALRTHADADRVFIDTTGRSPADRDALPLLEGNLRAGECATMLCLAAGTRGRDARVVLDAFAPLGLDAVCLTKWDETVAPGEALGAVVERGLPLSHVCFGQEVPQDIVAADPQALADAAFDLRHAQVAS